MLKAAWGNLRSLELSDAPLFRQWNNDEETHLWRGVHLPLTAEDAEIWVKERMVSKKEHLNFVIEINDSIKRHGTRPIGVIGLRNICFRSRRAELWIYIGDKNFWGQGHGARAITRLLELAFLELNLMRVWLECDAEYQAGIRCYEKAGFQKEGLHRAGYFRHGNYRNTMTMAVLAPEWQKKFISEGIKTHG